MATEPRARRGYLVVADISGYTSFLSGTELEHAQAIIEELTALIRARLTPPLRFVKLEGDAVLCYADGATFAVGERLIEVLEVCYFEFSSRLFDMARATTCPCAACASIDTLDLKFVAHYGTFVVRPTDGMEDLAGPDVILVHRMLKNSITDRTGCRAYVFFTDACLARMPGSLALPRHSETYESLGETLGGVHDLKPVLDEMRGAAREYISAEEADFEIAAEGPSPPAVVWQYCVDAEKRARWVLNEKSVEYQPNARGRIGAGATSHCAHRLGADALRHYVDWRPFSYFTNSMLSPKGEPVWTEMYEFHARDDGGTSGLVRIRLARRTLLARLMFRFVTRPLLRFLFGRAIAKLMRVIEEDMAAAGT